MLVSFNYLCLCLRLRLSTGSSVSILGSVCFVCRACCYPTLASIHFSAQPSILGRSRAMQCAIMFHSNSCDESISRCDERNQSQSPKQISGQRQSEAEAEAEAEPEPSSHPASQPAGQPTVVTRRPSRRKRAATRSVAGCWLARASKRARGTERHRETLGWTEREQPSLSLQPVCRCKLTTVSPTATPRNPEAVSLSRGVQSGV